MTMESSSTETSEQKQISRVLVCDDDSSFRKRLSRMLRDRGYVVFEAGCVSEGLEVIEEFSVDACLVDLRMPGGDGLQLVDSIARSRPSIRTVILTGFGSIQTAVEAVRRGAVQYLTKPTKIDEIIEAIDPESINASVSSEKSKAQTMPSLEEIESEYIHRVLTACEGNVTLAAKILGLHRRSLQRKLHSK